MKKTTLISLLFLFTCSATEEDNIIKIMSFRWTSDSKKCLVSVISVKEDMSNYNLNNQALLGYDVESGNLEMLEKASLSGSMASDNCTLAFQNDAEGKEGLWLANRCTGALSNLRGVKPKDGSPAISPDGETLAFTSRRAGGLEIYTLNLLKPNAEAVQITHGAPYKSYNPEWSADGKKLVYFLEKGDHKDQIWTIDASGENARNVSNDARHNFYPSWGPEGDIVYTVGGNQIYTMQSDGSGKRPLNGIESFMAGIAPDGKTLAYIRRKPSALVFVKYPSLEPVGELTGEQIMKWMANGR